MRYVIDTSALVKVFLNEPQSERVARLLDAAIVEDVELHAPSLLIYEINNALVSKRVAGRRHNDAVRFLFTWIDSNVLTIHDPDEDLLRRTQTIAAMDTRGQGYISSYDATFHALALRIDADFLTADETYLRKTQGLIGRVRLLASVG